MKRVLAATFQAFIGLSHLNQLRDTSMSSYTAHFTLINADSITCLEDGAVVIECLPDRFHNWCFLRYTRLRWVIGNLDLVAAFTII